MQSRENMLSTSAADSTVDSFHTAQEGSSVCINGEKGAVWMEECKLDEVTSKVSAGSPLKKQKHHADSSQGLPAQSISALALKLTRGNIATALSRAPTCFLISKQVPLKKPSPETPSARKRLCVRVLASEPATPDISTRQLSASALEVKPAVAPTQLSSQETSASPEVSGNQLHWRGSCQTDITKASALHRDMRQTHSSSTECSQPAKIHSQELPCELSAGQTSPTAKAQVLGLPEYTR